MKSLYKKLDTSGHFPDFKHKAKSWKANKKIRSKKERKILNDEKKEASDGESFLRDDA